MSLVIDVPCESWTPTSFGQPHVQGFLYHQPAGKKAWKRHYAIAAASFVLLFPEKEAEHPSKPVGALCYEDLEVLPLPPDLFSRTIARQQAWLNYKMVALRWVDGWAVGRVRGLQTSGSRRGFWYVFYAAVDEYQYHRLQRLAYGADKDWVLLAKRRHE